MRTMLRVVLERWGHDVLCAGNGIEALEILDRERCRVVISDVNMDRMNGIDLLDRIKERYPECAVIMLTGEERETVAPSLLSKGAHCVIRKTDFYYELLSALKQLFQRDNDTSIREPLSNYSIRFWSADEMVRQSLILDEEHP